MAFILSAWETRAVQRLMYDYKSSIPWGDVKLLTFAKVSFAKEFCQFFAIVSVKS